MTPSRVASWRNRLPDDNEPPSMPPPMPASAAPTEREVNDDESIAYSLVPPPLDFHANIFRVPHGQPIEAPAYWNKLPRSNNATPVQQTYPQSESNLSLSSSPFNRRPRDDNSAIRRPPRSIRSSFRNVSLRNVSITPSEMPYPFGLLSSMEPSDYGKAEQMLGLRRQSRPPPLPPKPFTRQAPAVRSHRSQRSLTALPYFNFDEELAVVSDGLEPQNGRTAWLHAIMAFFVVFNCWGLSNSFGLFQAYFQTTLLRHSSPSSIAWIGSTQLALVFGLGMPVGRLVDKGFFAPIFRTGSIIMVIGLFVSAWCTSLWSIWLVQGLITGLGMGMVFCAGTMALMTWFDETKIGIAMGLGAAGSCVGGIVYVLIARHFLITSGYATTMRILGGVAAATIIPPNLVFRMRTPHTYNSRANQASKTSANITWRTFTTPSYLLAAFGMFFAFLGIYSGFVYMITYAFDILLLPSTTSTNLLIYMLATNLPGRFLPALISDRCIGPLNTIIPSIFLSAAVIGLWLASAKSLASLTVIACFYGFVSAGVQVLYAPTVYTFCLEPAEPFNSLNPNHNNPNDADGAAKKQLLMDRMGVKAGSVFTCIGLACLVGTPIGGALIQYRVQRSLKAPFLGAQIFALACLVLGGLLLLMSRVARIGWAARRA